MYSSFLKILIYNTASLVCQSGADFWGGGVQGVVHVKHVQMCPRKIQKCCAYVCYYYGFNLKKISVKYNT